MNVRIKNWWRLQRLSWLALVVRPDVMARALILASIEHKGAEHIDDNELMRRAFQDKLNGKSNSESAAMAELCRRYDL